MKRLAFACLVLAAVLTGSARPEAVVVPLTHTKEPGPLLGVVRGLVLERLARIDPDTLQPLPGRRPALGTSVHAWAYSPDRSQLVVARQRANESVTVRFLAVGTMQRVAEVPMRLTFWVPALTWLSPERVVGLRETQIGSQLVTLDAHGGGVVGVRDLEGALSTFAHSPNGLLALFSPRDRIGPSRLLVVDGSGAVTWIDVDIWSGWQIVDEQTHLIRMRVPALAVDHRGERVYVVDAGGRVAEIDLATRAVSYHSVGVSRSLLGRFAGWLQPAAQAKAADGPVRYARWVSEGVLAVYGEDYVAVRDRAGSVHNAVRPSGLQLIDTRTWTTRMVDPEASSVAVDANGIVASSAVCERDTCRGDGITIYTLDGSERFHVLRGKAAWVAEIFGSRAYAAVSRERMRVIDLATGSIAARTAPLPRLLIAPAGPERG